MDCKQDFHKRLQGIAKNECAPQINRNYLSDKFAKELRRAREVSTKSYDRKCGEISTACAQELKCNLPCAESSYVPCDYKSDDRSTSPYSPKRRPAAEKPRSGRDSCPTSTSSQRSEDCAKVITRTLRKSHLAEDAPICKSAKLDDIDACVSSKSNGLQELEEKVDFLNQQAQQLLKQLRREQVEREKISEQYDEALDEVRRLRERERPSQEMEARIRRLECERDEAIAKSRTTQVDNEELRAKIDRLADENLRDRQRLVDKVASLENRMHASQADHDELIRRHNRNLEALTKLEAQEEEQKLRIIGLEDQKSDLQKQVDNLGLFIKDLEQTSKTLQERMDEKRYEVHQAREKIAELEELITKLDQHMLHEKDRFMQIQNDAYQAQTRNQELRTELRNALKKKTKSFEC